jgi:hypothetical protein
MPTLPLFAVENCSEGKLVGVKERAGAIPHLLFRIGFWTILSRYL